MQRPVGVDAEAWLRQCVHQAQAVPMDETRKVNYLADLAILGGLVEELKIPELLKYTSTLQILCEINGSALAIIEL